MFNIGLGEMAVIALIALLVFGPNKLPEIMRTLGKTLRSFQAESQRAADVLKQGLEEPPAPKAPGVVDVPDAPAPVALPEPAPPVPEERPEPVPVSTEPALPPAARHYEDT